MTVPCLDELLFSEIITFGDRLYSLSSFMLYSWRFISTNSSSPLGPILLTIILTSGFTSCRCDITFFVFSKQTAVHNLMSLVPQWITAADAFLTLDKSTRSWILSK